VTAFGQAALRLAAQIYAQSGGCKEMREEQDRLDNDLINAARLGDCEGCRRALDAGANIRAETALWDVEPLFLAVRSGSIDTVKLLLERRGNPYVADEWSTAVDWAIDEGNFAIAELLRCAMKEWDQREEMAYEDARLVTNPENARSSDVENAARIARKNKYNRVAIWLGHKVGRSNAKAFEDFVFGTYSIRIQYLDEAVTDHANPVGKDLPSSKQLHQGGRNDVIFALLEDDEPAFEKHMRCDHITWLEDEMDKQPAYHDWDGFVHIIWPSDWVDFRRDAKDWKW
jgi:hypothetical protein